MCHRQTGHSNRSKTSREPLLSDLRFVATRDIEGKSNGIFVRSSVLKVAIRAGGIRTGLTNAITANPEVSGGNALA